MEPHSSLPCAQQPSTGIHADPHQSNGSKNAITLLILQLFPTSYYFIPPANKYYSAPWSQTVLKEITYHSGWHISSESCLYASQHEHNSSLNVGEVSHLLFLSPSTREVILLYHNGTILLAYEHRS